MTQVLIVDDSRFLRRIMKGHLSTSRVSRLFPGGYAVVEAGSKQEAFNAAQRQPPDLMLLDIVMDEGERDGIDVLERTLKVAPACKVIMMTSVGQEDVIRLCLAKGAAGYLVKPFDEEQVASMLECVLSPASGAPTAHAQFPVLS